MKTNEILAEIYPKLNKLDLLAKFSPRDVGDYIVFDCPFCGSKDDGYVYHNGNSILCHRLNNCGQRLSLWDYVKEEFKLKTNRDVLMKLAQLAGISLPSAPDDFDEEAFNKAHEKTNLLEQTLLYFKERLFSPAGEGTLKYLQSRGYSVEEIKRMDLGFYPPQADLKRFLTNKGDLTLIENDTFSIFNPRMLGDTHTLAIPYRDLTSRLKGFIVRSLLSKEELEKLDLNKYYNNRGLHPSDQFFNMENNRGKAELVVMEGYLDALIITERACGTINVKDRGFVAVGKAYLSEPQIDNAVKHGTKRFILALDGDQAGQKAISKALDLIQNKGGQAYVCTLPASFKDPDELVRDRGIEAFEEVIKKAESGSVWKAKYLLQTHGLQGSPDEQDTPALMRDKILNEALIYEPTIPTKLERDAFISVICASLKISCEDIELERISYREKKVKEDQKHKANKLLREAEKLVQNGQFQEAQSLLRKNLHELGGEDEEFIVPPYAISEFEKDIQNLKPGLKTGFKTFDERISIPQQALTIVAGRTSHGKTTLLLNMLLNMVQLYPDKRFYFFSYEENRLKLVIKILMILSRVELDQYKNYEAFENYFRQWCSSSADIEEAKKQFDDLTRSGRLNIVSVPYNVVDLTAKMKSLNTRFDNVGAIFVDYIQKIKGMGQRDTRQLDLQRISAELLEGANSTQLPIILGAQLGRTDKSDKRSKVVRLDNIREAGDIEQDANLVIGIYNETMARAEEEIDNDNDSDNFEISEKIIDLELHILKNREGEKTKKPIKLTFNTPIWLLTDKTTEKLALLAEMTNSKVRCYKRKT